MPKQKKPSWSDRCWAWFFRDHGSEQLPTGGSENPWDEAGEENDDSPKAEPWSPSEMAGSLQRRYATAESHVAMLATECEEWAETLASVGCDLPDDRIGHPDASVAEKVRHVVQSYETEIADLKALDTSHEKELTLRREETIARLREVMTQRDEARGQVKELMAWRDSACGAKPAWGDFASKMSLLRSISLDATM